MQYTHLYFFYTSYTLNAIYTLYSTYILYPIHIPYTIHHIHYIQIKYGRVNDTVEVPIDDLESKARELNIYDLKAFYTSSIFKKLGFHVDSYRQVIVKTY